MIGADEVHVWTLDMHAASSDDDTSVLDDRDVATRDRLVLADQRERYGLRHALLRRVLSWCVPTVAPERWRFAVGPQGKPEIDSPWTARRLRFNLSHTRGWMAVAASLDVACGVDIEDLGRTLDVERLATVALTELERSDVLGTAPADRTRELLRRWTVKEAYLKGRGVGLDVPLHAIPTEHPAGSDPRLRRGPHTTDAAGWRFHQWTDPPELLVALAVHAAPGSQLNLCRHRSAPDFASDAPSRPSQEGLLPCTT